MPILVSCEGVSDETIPSRLDELILRSRLCSPSPLMLPLEDDNLSLGRIEISMPAFLSPLGKEILNSRLLLDIEDDKFSNSSRRAFSEEDNLERLEKLGKLSDRFPLDIAGVDDDGMVLSRSPLLLASSGN